MMSTNSSVGVGIDEETSYVSPDEPMLKELERRDGIYSFIFRELEDYKAKENLSATVLDISSSNTTTTLTTTNASESALTAVASTLSMLSTPFKISPELPEMLFAEIPLPKLTPKTITSHMHTPISYNDFKVPLPPLPPLLPCRPSLLASNLSRTQEHARELEVKKFAYSVKPIRPYQSIFCDRHRTHSYKPYRQINLRIAMPQFSHITEPLVRNRRHVLKESPQYNKSFSVSDSQVPDLRDLFPHDPDVYTPFKTPFTFSSTSDDFSKEQTQKSAITIIKMEIDRPHTKRCTRR